MTSKRSRYQRAAAGIAWVRLVFQLQQEDVEAIDAWGIPAGMTSRADCLRVLIRKGLECVKASAPAAEVSLDGRL